MKQILSVIIIARVWEAVAGTVNGSHSVRMPVMSRLKKGKVCFSSVFTGLSARPAWSHPRETGHHEGGFVWYKKRLTSRWSDIKEMD